MSRSAPRTGGVQMKNSTVGGTGSKPQFESPDLYRVIRLCCAVLLFLITVIPATSRAQTQQQAKPTGSKPTPESAVPAILAAFDQYEVVAMPAAHGLKDVDDFILTLIRIPALWGKVNDIEVESCTRSSPRNCKSRWQSWSMPSFTSALRI
jgi:hypothetical protein